MSEVPTSGRDVMRPHDSQNETPFDPAAWLAVYVDLGGGYCVTADGVWLHWSLKITEAEHEALAAHEMPLRRDLEKRNAVKALLLAQHTKGEASC